MKVFYLLIFVFLLFGADAQRRSTRTELSESDSTPKSVRRGRARFVTPPPEQQVEEEKRHEPANKRTVLRRRLEPQAETPRRNYEVEEIIDESPLETSRKSTKTRVLTENRYEAQNAPPVSSLFQPSTTEDLEEVIKSIGIHIPDTSSSTSVSPTPPNLETSSLDFSSGEISRIENEITKSQPETTTPLTPRTTRKTNVRSRNNFAASPTVASRVRSRTRVTRKPEEQVSTAAPTRTVVHRGSRRRPEVIESRTKEPSVIGASETVELPLRSRTGRKTVSPASRRTEEIRSSERTGNEPLQSRRSGSNRRPAETTTIRSRTRSRFRDVPPVIDEQKLEVLPLFERETKTVKPVRKVVSRRRNLSSGEEVETSASENDVKLVSESPRQRVIVETRTESSRRRRKQTTKPPVIKESVISEITEVTSKRTVIRKTIPKNKTPTTPKFVQRGRKKAEVNLSEVKNKTGLSSSEEEIDDSDNYPEHFKALLQAKKQKKESRSQQHLVTAPSTVTKTTEKVVISSPSTITSTTAQISSSEANRQLEDSENELDSPSSRPTPTRRRLPQSTTEKVTHTTKKFKAISSTVPSTTSIPLTVKDHRFHAKFNNEPEVTSNPIKPIRNPISTKSPRAVYSSRKTKESYSKNKSSTGQIPTLKKSNRYSSRYRNDASSRVRTSTNAPAYLPTVPTITPPTTSEYVWPEEENIEYSWSFSRLK